MLSCSWHWKNQAGSRTKGERRKRNTSSPTPFTRETAVKKVRATEDAWNSRDSEKVALAYTTDTRWRNRIHFA
jgi:Protein of unknown function (DUF1348)